MKRQFVADIRVLFYAPTYDDAKKVIYDLGGDIKAALGASANDVVLVPNSVEDAMTAPEKIAYEITGLRGIRFDEE